MKHNRTAEGLPSSYDYANKNIHRVWLQRTYYKSQLVATLMIQGLWGWIKDMHLCN